MKLVRVTITEKGGILLGKNTVCDGYETGRYVGVITHFHTDHAKYLPFALRFCETVLTTPATRDLLLVTQGEAFAPDAEKLEGLPYTQSVRFNDERVTLFPVKHVLGSAQVLVETEQGDRLVYTGDFLVPGTLPLEADVLVIEATYGLPSAIRRHDRGWVASSFIRFVKQSLFRGPVLVVAHQGKLQEIMNMLFEGGIDVPFLAQADVFDVAHVYRKYGIEIGDSLPLESKQAEEIEKDPHVAFSKRHPRLASYPVQIVVSGRSMIPFHRVNSHRYIVGLSSHADFHGLLWCIERSKARLVIVDGTRHHNATLFAHQVEKRLNVRCLVMPR